MERLRPVKGPRRVQSTSSWTLLKQSPHPSQTRVLMKGLEGRLRLKAAFAATTKLGGAGLIVDDRRHAAQRSALALDRVEVSADLEP